jgi:hypothetical protein
VEVCPVNASSTPIQPLCDDALTVSEESRLAMAEQFLAALTGNVDAPVTFQTFVDGDGESSARPTIIHDTLANAWEALQELQERGHGVFVMVNGGDGRGRAIANVRAVRALFYDADQEPLPDAAKLSPPPSLVVASGRGQHGYWLLEPGARVEDFTPAQKAIAARLGTDAKVVDAARVMRLPGTFHLKDRSRPRLVELLRCEPSRYTIAAVLRGLGAAPLQNEHQRDLRAAALPSGLVVLSSETRHRAEEYVACVDAVSGQGGNKATFRAAAALLRDFNLDRATAWDVLKKWNQTNARPPWDEQDLAQIFMNAEKYGHHAPGAALRELRPANDAMNEIQGQARADLISAGWCDLTVKMLEAEPPEKQFIWQDAIPVGDVGTLVGPGAAGKTALTVGLAVHCALGLPFLGRATRRCQTVFITLEDNRDDYLRKLKAWEHALGSAWDASAISENVKILDLRGTNVRLVRQDGREYVASLDAKLLADEICKRAPRAGLIAIETVSRCGGDESNSAMSALVSAAEELSAATGCAVLLVAHVSKQATREGNGDQHAARGGGAITDNGRFSITATLLEKDQEKGALAPGSCSEVEKRLVVLRVAKINCAPTGVIGVVERRPSKYQTVTVGLYVPESEEEKRARTGAALRDLVAKWSREGEVTPTSLHNKHAAELTVALEITTREIDSVLKNADDDDYIKREPRRARGGGERLLPVVVTGEVA